MTSQLAAIRIKFLDGVRLGFGLIVALMLMAYTQSTYAAAADAPVRVGSLQLEGAWARASMAGMKMGAGYLVIHNQGETDDELLSVASPVSERVEIHLSQMQDGVMRMRSAMPLTIGASERLSLAPGGMHVMLMGLSQPLAAGATFNLDLGLANGENLRVEVLVGQAAQMSRPETVSAP